MPARDSLTMRLRDGRTLGYAEYGDPAGRPLIYLHGHPGSRLEAAFLAGPAAGRGVRVIGVDQPGLGLSSYQARRTLLDFPADVTELAGHLGIGRFAVAGFSGGGPHALACAYRIPGRLTACGVVSGAWPPGLAAAVAGQWVPWLVLPPARRLFATRAAAARMLSVAVRLWPGPDRAACAQPWVRDIMAASVTESFRQGARGPAREGTVISARHWGFRLQDVRVPVRLWHGERDTQVRPAQARAAAARIPGCAATFFPGDAHMSALINHREEIVGALTARP